MSSVSPPIPNMIWVSGPRPWQRSRDELHELAGLLVEADHVQAPEGEGRVPDPGVAVVPVALPARRLGQRGRQRRDHRPGRLVGQPLERQRRALEGPAPGVVGKRPRSSQRRQSSTVQSTRATASAASFGPLSSSRHERQEKQRSPASSMRVPWATEPVDLERDVAEQAQRLAAAAGVGGQGVAGRRASSAPPRSRSRRPARRPSRSRPSVDALDRATSRCSASCGPELAGVHVRPVLLARGASTSASRTTSQPVSVIQLVSSTFVPGT